MPLAGFLCPDNLVIKLEDCLKKCRLENKLVTKRCKSLPFLRQAAKEKEWNGRPSTTQLLIGTRELYLRLKTDFYIKPSTKTSVIIGQGVHNLLYDLVDQGNEKAEETLYSQILHGTFDFYDPVIKTLYDYKTWGNYKITMLLDSSVKRKADALFEVVLQLYQYKHLLKMKYPEIKIENIIVQVINKEPIKKWSKNNSEIYAMDSPVFLLPPVDEQLVQDYFELKTLMLKASLKYGYAPKCSVRETWDGKKCIGYCHVVNECNLMSNNLDYDWYDLKTELRTMEVKVFNDICKGLKKQGKIIEGY